MPLSGRVCANTGLDAAVHDAMVAYSTPWCNVVTGFLTGVLTVAGLPIFLFYHACILYPASLIGHLPLVSPYPACVKDMTQMPTIYLLLWPYVFGLVGAAYGYLRHLDLQGSLRWRWRAGLVRPFHVLALLTGYVAYASTAWLSGSMLLFTGVPLLAIISGPALLFGWQYVHNKLVYYVSKPSWESLVANTVRIWFPRRLGLSPGSIISSQANNDGTLQILTDMQPTLVEDARNLAAALPGISRTEIYDANGMPIMEKERHKLSSTVEAGRIVAQLRSKRAKVWAAGGYETRHDVVHDISGRMLLAAVSVITFSIMLTLLWVALRGGFKPMTAEDLQWFFGKYGPSASPSEIRSLPKSMQPR